MSFPLTLKLKNLERGRQRVTDIVFNNLIVIKNRVRLPILRDAYAINTYFRIDLAGRCGARTQCSRLAAAFWTNALRGR